MALGSREYYKEGEQCAERITVADVLGLDAIVLIARDFDAQKRFYRDILGLRVEGDYGDAVFFRCDRQKLAIFAKSHHPEGTERLEGATKGISHLEFRVKRASLDALAKKLRDAGHHAYGDNFQDADGNLFHFNVE